MNVHSTHALDRNLISKIPPHGFSTARLLVVGDLMLDRYVLGEVTRISPEAPVPVLVMSDERTVAGGAANVALNVAGLQAQVIAAGVVGNDASGERLLDILSQNRVDIGAVLKDSTRPTTCKTRVMCGNHQIVRIDSEASEDLGTAVSSELSSRIQVIFDGGINAVLLSDYAKGALTRELTEWLIATCAAKKIPVLVDPKRSDYTPYAGATLITPNLKEFKTALTTLSIPLVDIGTSGAILRSRLDCATLLVTQGPHGMTAMTGEHAYHFPALAEEVFDVSGAGDTVIATVATCLASGMDVISAVQIANMAASLVVKHAGTVPVDWEELYSTVHQHSEPIAQDSAPAGARRVS